MIDTKETFDPIFGNNLKRKKPTCFDAIADEVKEAQNRLMDIHLMLERVLTADDLEEAQLAAEDALIEVKKIVFSNG